ncbi:MAG: CoA transferase, partial [Chloroflexota bacterium]|nr:CoA transferase [Chloroflexota bacterium]
PLFHAMFQLIGPAGAYVSARGLREPRPIDVNGSGAYRCGDGRYVQFDPSSYRFLPWFAEAAGVSHWGPELLDEIQLRNPENNRRLHAKLAELFLTRSAAEWEELGRRAGAALAFVRKPSEWIATEHARASGAAVQVADPELGPTWMPGFPVHATATPAAVRHPRHPPDADRAAILAELDSLSPTTVGDRALRSPCPTAVGEGRVTAAGEETELVSALQGIRVLDLCQVLAGPTGGRLLGEFGAEVVKVYAPHSRIGGHGYLNRGKRSLLVDVQSRDGLQVLWKLVERADVLLQNFPHGAAERYGIGYNQVKARKPDIIYSWLSCYGPGPWAGGRGYERQGQAVTGIEDRVGDPPSILGPYNLVDIGTGCLEAFAVGLGLYHRLRTGQGQEVQTSLAHTATYHQGPFFLSYEGKVWDEPRGWETLGTGPLQRFYRAQDRWFFLGARPIDAARLAEALGLPDLAGRQGSSLEPALESAFCSRPAADCVALLTQAGIAAQAVVGKAELMQEPWARASGLSLTQVASEVGEVVMPGVPVRLSRTPMRPGHAAGRPGGDAESILAELGLADQIPALERAWALQTQDLPPAW